MDSTRPRNVAPTWFISSASVILVIAGAAKLWSAFGRAQYLALNDPIIGIQFRHLLALTGMLELLIAGICLISKPQKMSVALIAWLATSFLLYRIGLWLMEWHRPCKCMGNLTDALHIPEQTADTVMKVILAYLLISSYMLLLADRRQRKPAPIFLPAQ